MKVLLRQRGVACECLGYIRHNKYEYIKYYLIQGPTETSSYSYYRNKEEFIRWLIASDYSVSLDVNKIDLSSRYAWVREDEIIFLNDTLMETE